MPDYCKHGLEMSQTCRKCGRMKVVEVPNFEAMRNSFTSSIDRLEETVRKMQIEISANPPPAAFSSRAEGSTDTEPEEAPDSKPVDAPPPPEQVFPWQRR